MPLIKSYSQRISTPECHATATWFKAILELQDDISEVLPYLNSELQCFDYNHDARILLWDDEENGKRYAFRPHEVVIAPIESREEANELVDYIVSTVNFIWDRKDQIEPSFEGRRIPPKVLDIFKLLPRSNCQECGFPTCMAFAAELRNDHSKLSLCPYINEKGYKNLVLQT